VARELVEKGAAAGSVVADKADERDRAEEVAEYSVLLPVLGVRWRPDRGFISARLVGVVDGRLEIGRIFSTRYWCSLLAIGRAWGSKCALLLASLA
jgi:hypothetical protein